MRTLLATENNSPNLYSKFPISKPSIEQSSSAKSGSSSARILSGSGQSIKIKRDDLSPVSKFREEQRDYQSKYVSPNRTSQSYNSGSTIPYFYDQGESVLQRPQSRDSLSSKLSEMSNYESKFRYRDYEKISNSSKLYGTNSSKTYSSANPSKIYNSNVYKYEYNKKRPASYKTKYSDNDEI